MHAIPNLLRRCLTALSLGTSEDALYPSEQPTPRVIRLSDHPADHLPAQGANASDADMDQSIAPRTETLDQADDCEQQGLCLLAQAALLRASVWCADRGQTILAETLRDDADEVATRELMGQRALLLRFDGADVNPA